MSKPVTEQIESYFKEEISNLSRMPIKNIKVIAGKKLIYARRLSCQMKAKK